MRLFPSGTFLIREHSQEVPHKFRWQDQQGECPKQAFADDLAEYWAKHFILGSSDNNLDIFQPNLFSFWCRTSNLTMVFSSVLAHFLVFHSFRPHSFQAKPWKRKRHEPPSRNWPLCGATSRRWGRQPLSFRIVVYDGLCASPTVELFSKATFALTGKMQRILRDVVKARLE